MFQIFNFLCKKSRLDQNFLTLHILIDHTEHTPTVTSFVNNMIYAPLALLGLLASASGKIYFKEDFNEKSWETRWTTSQSKVRLITLPVAFLLTLEF